MASSLSQVTGGGVRAAPGGGGGDLLFDAAMGAAYTGQVGLILCGAAVVFFLYVAASGHGAGARRPPPRDEPKLRRGRGFDVSKLRRARMAPRDPDLDRYS